MIIQPSSNEITNLLGNQELTEQPQGTENDFAALFNQQMQSQQPMMPMMPMMALQPVLMPAFAMGQNFAGMGGMSGAPFGNINITQNFFTDKETLAAMLLGADPAEGGELAEGAELAEVAEGELTAAAAEELPSTDLAASLPDDPLLLGDQLGQRIVEFSEQGYSDLDVTLNDKLYGPVSLDLKVSEGGVEMSVQTNSEELQAKLGDSKDALASYLETKGFTLNKFDVGGDVDVEEALADSGEGLESSTQSVEEQVYDQLLSKAISDSPISLINS